MDFLSDVAAWFGEVGRWTDDDGIIVRTVEHLWLAVFPMLLAVLISLPVAVWLGHRRIGAFVANAVVNIGRAIPSFGLIVLAAVFFARAGVSLRFWPAAVALLALAIPPIFTNAYTAIVTVPRETVEAARGMGFTETEVLWRIEVPMGAPLIFAGIRISFIQVLATVPLAAVLSSGGGLGQYVIRGFSQGPGGLVEVFSGAMLIAILTLGADWLLSRGERLILPEGLRGRSSEEIRVAASVS